MSVSEEDILRVATSLATGKQIKGANEIKSNYDYNSKEDIKSWGSGEYSLGGKSFKTKMDGSYKVKVTINGKEFKGEIDGGKVKFDNGNSFYLS